MPRITIEDVARAADCSIATVSLVLNGRGRVAEKTRRRVLKVQQDLGYVPNPAGRNLRTQKTNTVGLLFYPSCAKLFRNVFYAEIMEGLEEGVSAHSYDLLLAGGDFSTTPRRLPSFFQQNRVDAAVLLGAFPSSVVEEMARFEIPLLLLDSNHDDLPVDSITTDGYSGGRMVVEHLREMGHRRVVMMAYDMEDYNIDARVRGFEAGLRAGDMPVQGAVIRDFINHQEGFAKLHARLRGKDAPTAVVCVNDTLAVALASHLREAGYSLPGDVSLVGFDDDVYAREHSPRLTTIGIDKAALGRAGAQVLLDRLEAPATPVVKLRLPVHLIRGESVLDLGRR